MLKTVKAVIMVTACSYFFAMAFKMLCDIQADVYDLDQYSNKNPKPKDWTGDDDRKNLENDHFMREFEMERDQISDKDSVIKFMYYSFTTLTTVGFGDLHPRSNIERLFIAFVMLLGVAIFSLFMSDFIDIVTETILPPSDGDEDNLARFFEVIKSFNKHRDIHYELKSQIENYF